MGDNWEDTKYDDLIPNEEYKVGWISSVYTDRYGLNKDDMVRLVRKEDDCTVVVKKMSDSIFDQFQSEYTLAYSFITLHKKVTIVTKQLCTCNSRDLLLAGCCCSAFKNGDR